MKTICEADHACPVTATVKVMGGKYKPVILWNLYQNTLRYSEIHKIVPEATDKMLAQQLKEMEREGLISKKVYPEVPPKTEYTLTAFGESLMPVLDAMCDWGERYLEKLERPSCRKPYSKDRAEEAEHRKST